MHVGAKSVYVTDREMESIEKNLKVNHHHLIDTHITSVPFEWGQPLPPSLSPSPSFDVILGADIVYIEGTYPDLIDSLGLLCTDERSVILLSVKERYTKVEEFMKLLMDTGNFTYTVVHRERRAEIYRIVKKC